MGKNEVKDPELPSIIIPFEQIATAVFNAIRPLVDGIPKAVTDALTAFITAHDKEASEAFIRGYNSMVREEDRI